MTPVEAYNILLQRQMSEDRILMERTSLILLATAFLFVAFVMLLDPDFNAPIIRLLRIALPITGIFLSFLLYCFNQAASIALRFWHIAQRKIEEEAAEFDYMKENGIAPHVDQDDFVRGRKEFRRDQYNKLVLVPVVKPKGWWQKRLLPNSAIYRYCLPIAFLGLWVASLVLVLAG